jgi:hypothetical protein
MSRTDNFKSYVSEIGPLKKDDPDEVRDAQLTMVELARYGEADIPREQMKKLILMITPIKLQPPHLQP